MKRAWTLLLALCLALLLVACSEPPAEEPIGGEIDSDDVTDGGEIDGDEDEIGGDWHVWGLYDFEMVDDLEIAIDRQDTETGLRLGYDLYEGGDSMGGLLAELRPEDGGYAQEDLETDVWAFCDAHSVEDTVEMGAWFLYGDYNGDGRTDIGLPMKNGDILWYVQGEYGVDEPLFAFAEVQPVDMEKELEWRTRQEYRFETLSDGLTLAITVRGSEGWETGFDVYEDLGEGAPRGALLGGLYWGDALYERMYFDPASCMVFADHNGDGRVDIGLESLYGDVLWYLQNENSCFTYAETELAADLSHLAGKWVLEEDETSYDTRWYEIDATGRKFSYYIDTFEYDGIILPAGEENGVPRYEIVESHGGMRDWLYLLENGQLQEGVKESADDYVLLYNRVD